MNFKWGTNYCFLAWEVCGMRTNSRLPFPDNLVQLSPWTLQLISVVSHTALSTHRSLSAILSDMTITSTNKQLRTSVTSVTWVNSLTSRARVWGNFSLLLHLLAMWPNLPHLWYLKRGPLAPDFSRKERMASSSSRESSMAWNKRMDSPLLRTIVWMLSLWRPCKKKIA